MEGFVGLGVEAVCPTMTLMREVVCCLKNSKDLKSEGQW
jgi:hypothetical protein